MVGTRIVWRETYRPLDGCRVKSNFASGWPLHAERWEYVMRRLTPSHIIFFFLFFLLSRLFFFLILRSKSSPALGCISAPPNFLRKTYKLKNVFQVAEKLIGFKLFLISYRSCPQ